MVNRFLFVMIGVILPHLSLSQIISELHPRLTGTVKSIRYTAYSDKGEKRDIFNGNYLLLFDKRGKLVQSKEFEYRLGSDVLIQSNEYQYDQQGRLISIKNHFGLTTIDYQVNGDKVTKAVFKRDNKITRSLVYDTNKRENSSPVYTFYSGYPVEDNKSTDKFEYKYDDQGNIIEFLGFGRDTRRRDFWLYSKLKFTYEGNNLTNMQWYDVEKKIWGLAQVFKYKLDKKGNWIEQTCYEDSYIRWIIKRNIEYYN